MTAAEDPRNARSDDPWTSLVGTRGINPSHKTRLLGFLRAADRPIGWTSGEVRDSKLGLQHENIWRRLSDLNRDGSTYIVTGLGNVELSRVDPSTGQPQRAHRAVPHWPDFVPVEGEKMILPPCVLWIDPGGMTGLAWYVAGSRFHVGEWPFQEAGDRIEQTCKEYRSRCWLGWERYDINVNVPQTDAHQAIEVIGVAKRMAGQYGCRVLKAAAPNQRKVATKEMLQALQWWAAGQDDSQSAAAHMLAWMLRSNAAPPGVREALKELKGT